MSFECPDCEREFDTEQGMRTHQARSHKVRAGDADALFELVGQATAILFPNPPPSRYIEIGEWQKATMRLMGRQ